MGTPFIGEIRMFGGNLPPAGWALCDGSLLPISENEALFQLIGTTYGGDGQATFALPDLRGRVPVHQGSGPGLPSRVIGEQFGVEQVTLTVANLPSHDHGLRVHAGSGTTDDPSGSVVAGHPADDNYATSSPTTPLAAAAVGPAVPAFAAQPHENVQPSLPIQFIISLFGIFPSPT
jgi:microcystin-dependent protein